MAKYQYKTIEIYQKNTSLIVTPSKLFLEEELASWVAFGQSQKDRLEATISALGLERAAASAETTELTEQLRSVVEALGTITDEDNCQTFIKAHEHNPIVTAMQTCMSNKLISSTILNSHRQVHDKDADLIYTKSTALYVIELIHFTMVNQGCNIHYILPPQHHASKQVAQGFCVVNLEPLHRALEITGARNHSVFSIDLDINAEQANFADYNDGAQLFDLCGCHPKKAIYPLQEGRAQDYTFLEPKSDNIERCFVTTSTHLKNKDRKKTISHITRRIDTFLDKISKGDKLILNLGLDSVHNSVTHSTWGFIFTKAEITSIVHHIQDICKTKQVRLILSFEGGYDDTVNKAIMPLVLDRTRARQPLLAFSELKSEQYHTPQAKPKKQRKNRNTKPSRRRTDQRQSRIIEKILLQELKTQQENRRWFASLAFENGNNGAIHISHATTRDPRDIAIKLQEMYVSNFEQWLLIASRSYETAKTPTVTALNPAERHRQYTKQPGYIVNQLTYITTLSRHIASSKTSENLSASYNQNIAQATDLLEKFIRLNAYLSITAEQIIHRSWWALFHERHLANLTAIRSHDSRNLNAHNIPAELGTYWNEANQQRVSAAFLEKTSSLTEEKPPLRLDTKQGEGNNQHKKSPCTVATSITPKAATPKRPKPQKRKIPHKVRQEKKPRLPHQAFEISKVSSYKVLIAGKNVRTVLSTWYETDFERWLTTANKALTCLQETEKQQVKPSAHSLYADIITYIDLLTQKLASNISSDTPVLTTKQIEICRTSLIGFIQYYCRWQHELHTFPTLDDASQFDANNIDKLLARYAWISTHEKANAHLKICWYKRPPNTAAIFNAQYWQSHDKSAMQAWQKIMREKAITPDNTLTAPDKPPANSDQSASPALSFFAEVCQTQSKVSSQSPSTTEHRTTTKHREPLHQLSPPSIPTLVLTRPALSNNGPFITKEDVYTPFTCTGARNSSRSVSFETSQASATPIGSSKPPTTDWYSADEVTEWFEATRSRLYGGHPFS